MGGWSILDADIHAQTSLAPRCLDKIVAGGEDGPVVPSQHMESCYILGCLVSIVRERGQEHSKSDCVRSDLPYLSALSWSSFTREDCGSIFIMKFRVPRMLCDVPDISRGAAWHLVAAVVTFDLVLIGLLGIFLDRFTGGMVDILHMMCRRREHATVLATKSVNGIGQACLRSQVQQILVGRRSRC